MKNFVFKTILPYVVLFFLFFLSLAKSHAQIDTFPSPIIKSNRLGPYKKYRQNIPIGVDKSGATYFFMFEGAERTPFLSHFDSAMNEINSVELKLENNGKTLYLQTALLVKDELFIISSLQDESSQKIITYAQTVNKTTLLPDNNIRELCSMDFPKSMNGCYRTAVTSYRFLIEVIKSRDESKIMICNTSFCQFNNTLSVFVFDHALNFLWRKVINADINDIEGIDFDNNGNVFFLMKSVDSKRLLDSGIPNNYFAFYLIAFFDKGVEIKEFPFFLSEKVISDMAMSVDNNNNVICSGFYMKPDPMRVSGSYFFKIDQNLKVVTKETYNDFNEKLYLTKCTADEVLKIKEDVKKGKSFPHFSHFTVKLYCSETGSLVLTGEVHTNSTGEYPAAYFRQILSFKYSNNGDLIWSKKIPKYQQTNGGGTYSSYFATFVGEDFYIIYNDNTSNFKIQPCEVPDIFTLRSEFILVVVKINTGGKAVKKYMLPNIKQDVWMIPTISKIYNKDQLILIGDSYTDNSYKFFKTTLKY